MLVSCMKKKNEAAKLKPRDLDSKSPGGPPTPGGANKSGGAGGGGGAGDANSLLKKEVKGENPRRCLFCVSFSGVFESQNFVG